MKLRVLAVLASAVCVGLAAQVTSAPAAASCQITPSQGAGPYGGTGAAPPKRSKIGTGHVLTGRVLRYPDCAPLKGAVVDFWQAGPRGRYTPATRGRVITRADGSFRIEGPVPGSYGGRPGHIHLRVLYGGYEELLTTYFVRNGVRSAKLTLVLEPLL